MEQFIGLALGLVVLGIAACLLGGSILPLLVVAAVIWTVGQFFGGFSNHNRR
jgi:hypothetical protein